MGRIPDQVIDEIRDRLPVSQVVGRRVALKKAGREYRGLSPFKTEKTPSFYVNDQKKFYHCFSSGEHGDIFDFLMKIEGVTFREAAERLADEAGVALPKQEQETEEQRAALDQTARLYQICEDTAKFFEDTLNSESGREGRAYLARRGVDLATQKEFRLGLAPNARTSALAYLKTKGHGVADMVTAGVVIETDESHEIYDRFRHRVMFPIRDTKGRVIAFGGRALDAAAPAKYLNSNDTPLFHKGRVLYNMDQARPHIHIASRAIVVEGYMDVIAMWTAGFRDCVAALGTALTQDHMTALWRVEPKPILLFDGDSAGQRAAHRALDIVLPNIGPETTARFAQLPGGADPDDFVKQYGAERMQEALDQAKPFFDCLWDRETRDLQTFEDKAALDLRFKALERKIVNRDMVRFFRAEARRRINVLLYGEPIARGPRSDADGKPGEWRDRDRGRGFQGATGLKTKRAPGSRATEPVPAWKLRAPHVGLLGTPDPTLPPRVTRDLEDRLQQHDTIAAREAWIIAVALDYPWLAQDCIEPLSALKIDWGDGERLLKTICDAIGSMARDTGNNDDNDARLKTTLQQALIEAGQEKIAARAGSVAGPIRLGEDVTTEAGRDDMTARMRSEIEQTRVISGHRREIKEAMKSAQTGEAGEAGSLEAKISEIKTSEIDDARTASGRG